MEPVVNSPDGTLIFTPTLPRDWKGAILSGSQPFFYEGKLGTITVQKFYAPHFSICYAVAQFFKKIKLSWQENSMLNLRFIFEGGLRYRDEGNKLIKLRPGQLNGVYAPDRVTPVEFQKGNFETLVISYDTVIVQELLPRFPQIRSFRPESSIQWIRQVDENYSLLNTHYKDEARRFFYETKIREQLLSFLQPPPQEGFEKFSDYEIQRIYEVDHKILKDLNQHYSTSDLAHFARMPEGKLVELFKEIIGVSMFDRYKEAKLEKARKYLLETDVQVKVLYEMVGYESYTGFVDAFKKRFGISPLRYRKKFRPF